MIPRASAALAITCAVLGFTMVVAALLATSEIGIVFFDGGVWLLITAIGLALGWVVMRDRSGRQ